MARHRFRSQPALQRSGGRSPSGLLGIGLLAGAGLGVGILFGNLIRSSGPIEPTQRVYAAIPIPADQPAQSPPAAAAPIAAPAQAPAAGPATPRVLQPPPLRLAKATKPPRATKPKPAAVSPVAPQLEWEQQRRDYVRARAAYDDNERRAGFRWAQQNNIRLERYCRVAAQRTPAFMEGCVSYLHAGRSEPPGRGGPPASADQG